MHHHDILFKDLMRRRTLDMNFLSRYAEHISNLVIRPEGQIGDEDITCAGQTISTTVAAARQQADSLSARPHHCRIPALQRSPIAVAMSNFARDHGGG
jgi:hypothetical protein